MQPYSIETHGQLHPHLSHEWLLTNGLGGFASSSVVGCNTRKYHGILVAATLPPVGRMMLVNRIGEILKLDGSDELLELSINQFGDNHFHPRGDKFLKRFELDRKAVWHFDVRGVKVVKSLELLWKRNVAVVKYDIDPGAHTVELNLLPFVSLRDFHAERPRGTDFKSAPAGKSVVVSEGSLAAKIESDVARYTHEPDWWTGHVYRIETERVQDDREDLFKPGMFVFKTDKPVSVTLTISLEPEVKLPRDIGVSPMREATGIGGTPISHPGNAKPSLTIQRLIRATDDFIVARRNPDGSDGVSVIAGYPWFSDWGRDTMISLPGLFFTTGRFEEAARVLTVFAAYTSQGMIPNRFDDYTSAPEYNTVDASLWFIHACFEYLRLTKDHSTFETKLLPACRDIIAGYSKGTRYNIHMDPSDGLIYQGDATTQLTWMDAKMGEKVFTPRHGKAVEINALWYNALCLMNAKPLAEKVRESFVRAFWISPFRGLNDIVDGARKDNSIRPNQIFAVSLPHSPLDAQQQAAVVEVVRRELLTPFGLRTLAAGDPRYCPRYQGDRYTRDNAYHNGTVWPWLIGAFLDAYLRVNNRSQESIQQARSWLAPLIDHLSSDGCIGSISEIFDAEPPQRPVGCCAQAWSVSEVLRLALELDM